MTHLSLDMPAPPVSADDGARTHEIIARGRPLPEAVEGKSRNWAILRAKGHRSWMHLGTRLHHGMADHGVYQRLLGSRSARTKRPFPLNSLIWPAVMVRRPCTRVPLQVHARMFARPGLMQPS